MRKLKELENRIKMLECFVSRGHSLLIGSVMSYKSVGSNTITITLKCLHCNYELTKSVSELSEKEKAAAIRLGLLPKEKVE